jgi:uncharacterized protein YaiE (UPF0345 family)
MSEFENVTIAKQANVYFDGKVTSHTAHFANGTTRFKLNILSPTDYCCSFLD